MGLWLMVRLWNGFMFYGEAVKWVYGWLWGCKIGLWLMVRLWNRFHRDHYLSDSLFSLPPVGEGHICYSIEDYLRSDYLLDSGWATFPLNYPIVFLNSSTQTHQISCSLIFFKLFVPCILSTYEIKNQQMSLFQFYSYINGSVHVSGPQAHPQENSHSCSHNH
jgi:hypothetical protein